jgi:hypothetical protein
MPSINGRKVWNFCRIVLLAFGLALYLALVFGLQSLIVSLTCVVLLCLDPHYNATDGKLQD